MTDNYKEPVNGEYDDATDRILKEIDVDCDVDEEMEEDEEIEDDDEQENPGDVI